MHKLNLLSFLMALSVNEAYSASYDSKNTPKNTKYDEGFSIFNTYSTKHW